MSKTCIVIEQMRDTYGNLLQMWGVYCLTAHVNTDAVMVKKHETRALLSMHDSLLAAQKCVSQHK